MSLNSTKTQVKLSPSAEKLYKSNDGAYEFTLAGGHTGADITDGRLKLNLEIDTRGTNKMNGLLDIVDTHAHKALYHGWVTENSFLNSGTLPESKGTHRDFDLISSSPHWIHGSQILDDAFDIMISIGLSDNSKRTFLDI